MSLGHGAKIVTDGLQFAYDMGSVRSWKGKPTTNAIPSPDFDAGLTAPYQYVSGTGASIQIVSDPSAPSPHKRVLKHINPNASESTTGPHSGASSRLLSAASGQTWTGSVYVRTETPGTQLEMFVFGLNASNSYINFSSGSKTIQPEDGWVLFTKSHTFTDANVTGITTRLDVNNNATVYWSNWQLEQSSFATQFVNGARSNSQSIIDWKGGNDVFISTSSTRINHINASSFEYVQDGTSSATTSNIAGSNTQTKYTRIVWFKPTVLGSNKYIMLNSVGNNADMCIHINNSKVSFHQYTNSNTNGTTSGDFSVDGTTTLVAGQVYCGAIVVDRTLTTNNIKVYLNGELETTGSRQIGNSGSSGIRFATASSYLSGRDYAGEIYAAYHYDRLLTDDEIKQNFNALRGRFGI